MPPLLAATLENSRRKGSKLRALEKSCLVVTGEQIGRCWRGFGEIGKEAGVMTGSQDLALASAGGSGF